MMKIFVPLDGKPESERFLPYLGQLAAVWKAQLRLVRIVDPAGFAALPVSEYGESMAAAQAEAENYLREKASMLSGILVDFVCRRGPVSQILCELAEPGDLLAFAPRGHSGLTRWFFGSVAEHVLRDASCPVLLLRGETHVCFQNLLLPVDNSEASLEVCRRTREFVAEAAQVTLLHCHEEYLDYGWCKDFEALTEGKERWELVCRPGKAADLICDWANESHSDLIAMATRGRGGWEHFWKGSVTERVARGAPCPVLVFPPASLGCRQALMKAEDDHR